jgi:hypothetical protein
VPNQNIHTLVCMLNCIYFLSLNILLGELYCVMFLFLEPVVCAMLNIFCTAIEVEMWIIRWAWNQRLRRSMTGVLVISAKRGHFLLLEPKIA